LPRLAHQSDASLRTKRKGALHGVVEAFTIQRSRSLPKTDDHGAG
jgi:hypothetical protein